ncbi:MAG: NUDIX domain-containing protein [Chromatiales bacterium]|jgi:ADP-ribose pyrophosphatase|nr:NUDIX domain-containing protein [Chromatiales bacterium]MDX9768479.1 NUDIX domain-containing protein [Ectothiorhodospiraceae bacterium]
MKWEILENLSAFRGFFEIRKLRLRHTLFGGGDLIVERELLNRHQAVAVLPYDARRDRVVLVRQFRVGALESPRGPWLTEIVAGLVDPGETAEAVAHREAMEEAGCRLGELIRLYDYYSSPGSASERIALFVGEVDSEGVGGVHGLAHEGEDIAVDVVAADEAFAWLDGGIIDSAMPIIALQWLRMHRDMLRERWG